MRSWLIHLPRIYKRIILVCSDLLLLAVSLAACFQLRLGWNTLDILAGYAPVFLVTPLCVIYFLYRLGLYSSITRHVGLEVMVVLTRGISFGVLVVLLIFFLVPIQPQLPRSVLLAFWVLSIFSLFTARLVAGRWLHGTSFSALAMDLAGWKKRGKHRGRPVIVYGAGEAGRQLAAALAGGDRYAPLGFVDDSESLQGEVVAGLKVYAPGEIDEILELQPELEIFLALPSISRHRRQQIIRFLEPLDVHVRSVPSMEELARGLVTVDEIREVDVADILGRESVPPMEDLLENSVRDRRILVTGAGGSIGSELCRQIVKYGPRSLVMLDHSEYSLYSQYSEIEELLTRLGSDVALEPVIGSVLDTPLLDRILADHRIDTVYHAAAYKHVPLVESNACQGFQNNVLGTLSVVSAAVRSGVERFVLVSTDKAVRPTNIMGVTKRLAELILQAFSVETHLPVTAGVPVSAENRHGTPNNTCLTMVRFGNVLDSSGSVIPKFRRQIRAGGPVTVTHRNVTRFFMTIPEAAELVLQATALGKGGDVFILDMGKPVKIEHLARKLIHLSGFSLRDEEHPDGDIEIAYTGIRPGEKLYEELLIDDHASATCHPKIWRANERVIPWSELQALLADIQRCFEEGENAARLCALLSRDEIGYCPSPVPAVDKACHS